MQRGSKIKQKAFRREAEVGEAEEGVLVKRPGFDVGPQVPPPAVRPAFYLLSYSVKVRQGTRSWRTGHADGELPMEAHTRM